MKRIVLLGLLLLPMLVIAQGKINKTDTFTVSIEKAIGTDHYIIDLKDRIECEADAKAIYKNNTLLKKIGAEAKRKKCKVQLVYYTEQFRDEYLNQTPYDALDAFYIIKRAFGDTSLVASEIIRYQAPNSKYTGKVQIIFF